MGRHSVSYLTTGYLGRLGGLAVAVGIGAAAVGGAGAAHADETAGDTGPRPSDESPADGPAPDVATESDAAETKTPKTPTVPKRPTVPEMNLGRTNSAAAVRDSVPDTLPDSVPDSVPDAVPDAWPDSVPDSVPDAVPDSLPGLIASVPERLASALLDATRAGLRDPAGAPADGETTRPVQSRGSLKSPKAADDPPVTRPTESATPAADPFVRELNDAAEAAIRGEITPLRPAPEPVEPAAATTTVAPARTAAPPAPAPPVLANPIATVVRGVLAAIGIAPAATSGDTPTTPMPLLLGVLQLVHREIERFTAAFAPPAATLASAQTVVDPAVSPGVPSPADDVPTAYGDIGKWMLERNGQISDWGGQPHDGRTLLEPVNVIIVDPQSNSPAEATWRLNSAMFWSGFPSQPIHSGGFQGEIDDVVYGQRPVLPLFGYSNNFFLFTNDHGRIFGPDPVETSTGYVWTGSFSTEAFTFYNFLPAHSYVSSNTARTALAMAMVMSGRATYGGMVPLDNAYNTDTTTTGDHDGYAVVLVLR